MKNSVVQDNKCPSCFASISWNAKEQKFKCEYCGNSFTLDEMKKYNNASSETNNQKKNFKEITEDDKLISYTCKNCGAEIISDENNIATFCVYCGNTAILKQKIESGIFPNYIIPFKNTKEDAKNEYNKLLKGKFFLAKEFSNEKNVEKITGIYIPFWAYDISIDGEVDFKSEDKREWTSGDTKYEEIKTYHVTIEGHYDFEKILCDASKNFKDDLMDSIAPYKFDGLEEYNHAYLSGYLADKYDVNCDEAYNRAKERSVNSAIGNARTITGHYTDNYMGNKYNINNKKSYYILLPVWMLNTKYNDKIYTFAMNGQTGKIVGNLPMNRVKFILFTILIFISSFVLITLIIFLIGVLL